MNQMVRRHVFGKKVATGDTDEHDHYDIGAGTSILIPSCTRFTSSIVSTVEV